MTLSLEQVDAIAKLARLELAPEEREQFTKQLSGILDFVAKLNAVETADVEPMAHPLPISNVFGADEVAAETTGELEAVRAAFPARTGDLLKVQNVFGK